MSNRDDMIVKARGAIDACARDDTKEFMMITMDAPKRGETEAEIITNGMQVARSVTIMMTLVHQLLGDEAFAKYIAGLLITQAIMSPCTCDDCKPTEH